MSSHRIPVIEEVAAVGRESIETGALRIRLEEERSEQRLDLQTTLTTARFVRVPVGEAVQNIAEPQWRGDAFVVPVYERRPVVTYETVLVEEIHISQVRSDSSEEVKVPLSRQRVVIERRAQGGEWAESET